jgi:UDP-glucose 4-epimerase
MMLLSHCRALVTGGAGFIGSHLVERLLEEENEVVCFDSLSTYYHGKEDNIKQCLPQKRFSFVKGDVLDTPSLLGAAAGCELVFHLAAQPGVRYSLEHPEEVARVNVEGTVSVLEASRRIDAKRVIFASSSSVYGIPRYVPINENHPTEPLSPYGASKLSAEEFCRNYVSLYGIDVVILRYFTAYGPRQRPDMAIRKFVSAALDGTSPTVFGTGDQTRDFTYVDDIVAGTLLAASASSANGTVLNLGSGTSVKVSEIVKLIGKLVSGCEMHPLLVGSVSGESPHTWADITRAKNLLGYEPRVELEEGLRIFLKWMMETRRTRVK